MCFHRPSCQTPFSGELDRPVDVALRPVVDEVDRRGRGRRRRCRAGAPRRRRSRRARPRGRSGSRSRRRASASRRRTGRCGGSRRPSWMSSPRSLITLLTIFGIAPMNIGVESDSASSLPSRVEDAGAEVLGLADDRRVRHAVEHARHLLGDRRERAADRRASGSASRARRRARRSARGARRAVDHDVAVAVDLGLEPGRDRPWSCRTARRSPGPTIRSPARSRSRS